MTRTTLLVDGKIPAGTICPFRDKCELANNPVSCGHKGEQHNTDYSCGAARGFDLLSDKLQSKKEQTITIGTRLIDDKGFIRSVSMIGDVSTDTMTLFTLDNNEDAFAYFHKDDKFTTNPFMDKQDVGLKFFEIQLGKEYLDNEGYPHFFVGKEAIMVQPDGSKNFHSTESMVYFQDGIYRSNIPALAIAGEANDHVRAVTNDRKHKREDFVDVCASDQDSIPKDSNPFHYDFGNMGTTLVNGWLVMHAGPPSKDMNTPTTYLILVNTHSGQRIKLDLSKRK